MCGKSLRRCWLLLAALLFLLGPTFSAAAEPEDCETLLEECARRLERSITEREMLSFVVEKQSDLLIDQSLFIVNQQTQLNERDEALSQIESSLTDLEAEIRAEAIRLGALTGVGGLLVGIIIGLVF